MQEWFWHLSVDPQYSTKASGEPILCMEDPRILVSCQILVTLAIYEKFERDWICLSDKHSRYHTQEEFWHQSDDLYKEHWNVPQKLAEKQYTCGRSCNISSLWVSK